MAERPQQAYQCHSKGCSHGYGSTFYAAPEDWFIVRGFTPPKNCPTCRNWIKKQEDESTWCTSCKIAIRIPARYKISHHKRTGVWELPEECRRCEEGKKPQQGGRDLRPDEENTNFEKESDDKFEDIADGIPVEPRVIVTHAAYYEQPRKNDGMLRRVHIERHLEGSPHQEPGKTPSAFGEGPDDFPVLIAEIADTFANGNPQWAREYLERRAGSDQIVRLTLLNDGHIEKTVINANASPAGHELITTFDNKTIEWALNKYGRKSRPGKVQ